MSFATQWLEKWPGEMVVKTDTRQRTAAVTHFVPPLILCQISGCAGAAVRGFTIQENSSPSLPALLVLRVANYMQFQP
jgi:hypothetical protein